MNQQSISACRVLPIRPTSIIKKHSPISKLCKLHKFDTSIHRSEMASSISEAVHILSSDSSQLKLKALQFLRSQLVRPYSVSLKMPPAYLFQILLQILNNEGKDNQRLLSLQIVQYYLAGQPNIIPQMDEAKAVNVLVQLLDSPSIEIMYRVITCLQKVVIISRKHHLLIKNLRGDCILAKIINYYGISLEVKRSAFLTMVLISENRHFYLLDFRLIQFCFEQLCKLVKYSRAVDEEIIQICCQVILDHWESPLVKKSVFQAHFISKLIHLLNQSDISSLQHILSVLEYISEGCAHSAIEILDHQNLPVLIKLLQSNSLTVRKNCTFYIGCFIKNVQNPLQFLILEESLTNQLLLMLSMDQQGIRLSLFIFFCNLLMRQSSRGHNVIIGDFCIKFGFMDCIFEGLNCKDLDVVEMSVILSKELLEMVRLRQCSPNLLAALLKLKHSGIDQTCEIEEEVEWLINYAKTASQ